TPEALRQLDGIDGPARDEARDLRELLWCSIDNDDSRDLDQLSVCEELAGGAIPILVAVADVDAPVHARTPLAREAWHNTTSVYTAAEIFPMLPERLSTDLTSLNPNVDRVALVIEYRVDADGEARDGSVYRARVHSQAKLAYDSVGAWLDGKGELP